MGVRRYLIASVGLSAAALSSAGVLVNQSDYANFGWGSDGVPGQFYNARQAEDFVLSMDATLTGLSWWGYSENVFNSDLTNMSSWVVRIYDGDLSAVGGELWSGTFAKADTNVMDTGSQSTALGNVFMQSVSLPAVQLTAGDYWISIGAVCVDPLGDSWFWNVTDSLYNNTSAEESPFGSGYAILTDDFSLVLEGTVVPEPASLVVLGGLAALAIRRRR